MFQPFPRSELEAIDEISWLETLANHIRSQVETLPYDFDFQKVAALPIPAQTIFYLWLFFCEVDGNGLEVFLLQHPANIIIGSHAGLKAVGATELLTRLEATIPHAVASESAEFSASDQMSWFEKFPLNPAFPTLQSADDQIHLLTSELPAQVAAYIRANLDILTN